MRILVNYSSKEQAYLPVLQFFLRKKNLTAIATSSTLSMGELISKAQVASCEGIFCCNEETLFNLVPGERPSLDSYRGSLLNFSIPTIIGNSLTHTQTVEYGSWLLEKDLEKFLLLKKTPPLPFSYEVLETFPIQEEAFSFLKDCVLIAYDIETKTLPEDENSLEVGETFITCCAWAGLHKDGRIKTFVLPLVDFLEDHWKDDSSYCRAISFMRSINSLDLPKVMHNGMYDAFHSIIYGAAPINWTLDTMALAWSEFSVLPKDLSFTASLVLPDYCQWKGDASTASKTKDINLYWTYNAKDTFTTLRIAIHYLFNLPEYARRNYATQFKLVYPFLYCGFEGILIDEKKRISLMKAAEEEQKKALLSLQTSVADPSFNPGSPKQVKHYVYEIFGAASPNIGTKKKEGKKERIINGTDVKNLTAVGEQHPLLLRLTDNIISYREKQKAIGTYFTFLQKNGRLLFSINPFGTETGRASASSSALWCGTQIQNIPPYCKEMLVADEGFTLVEIDNKQSEGFCTAFISGDENMIAALSDRSKDFYKSLGTLFFGIPYEKVTKEFRNKVLKKINHGVSYRMGAATFVSNVDKKDLFLGAETLGIKITMAAKAREGEMTLKDFAAMCLEKYHAPFPRVREWYADIKLRIMTSNRLVSPLGWTRFFFLDRNGSISYTSQTEAVAHEPQNLSVSILNIGLWKIWNLVKEEHGAIRLKAQIHDSIFFQVKDSRLELMERANLLMQNPIKIRGKTLLIPTDVKTSKVWKEEE